MRTRRGLCYPRPQWAVEEEEEEESRSRKRRRWLPVGGDDSVPGMAAENPAGDRTDFFDGLPDDLVVSILCKLSASAASPSDLVSVLRTCKRLHGLGTNPLVLSKASAKSLAIRAKNWSESTDRFFKRCADAGNLEARYILGMIRFYCLQDRASGASLMAQAAMGSHAAALYSLAVIQFNGSGGSKGDKDLRAGVALCARAAFLGHIDALRELGHCLQDGYGVRRNVAEGRRFLVQANARELAAAHPANRFMVQWFASNGTGGGSGDEGLRLCSHRGCGRPETRRQEFRRCSVCGAVNYCSRACQALHWKLAHKAECAPTERWLDAGGFPRRTTVRSGQKQLPLIENLSRAGRAQPVCPSLGSIIRYIRRVTGAWVRKLLLSWSMSDKSVAIAGQGAAGWFSVSVRDRRARAMDGGMDSPVGRSPRTPEAEIGHRLEDLWDVQQPQLSPSQKLNSCFEDLPVSSFPAAPPSQVIDIPSDASLADAVETLSKHKILSAPVRNVNAPEDASWIDKYIGIVEFPGIAVWLLHQFEIANSNPEDAASMGGCFFETLTSSEFYKNTKVEDIAGSFRWAPFLALQNSDSFLTMLLLLSKYRMKSLPVVDLGEGKIENVITQSAVVHMLAECVGLHWFENWGSKKLYELGLPIMKPNRLLKVNEEEPVLKAFKLMREKGIGGLPVVNESGERAIGNISIRDVQYLLTAPEIYKDYRSITVKNFLTAVRSYLEEHQEASPMLRDLVTCKRDDTLEDIILRLDHEKIHRIYVVDKEENLQGVITLRDIISKLVHEPHGYFGDFFYGVVPLPESSRV
ncbi:unnamed protein product [Musa hybrid cultivar]